MRRLALLAFVLWSRPGFAATVVSERVLELRPTQIAVGMIEVGDRLLKIQAMGRSELESYLSKHPVPVVRGPQDRLYMVDHHHLARAAWEAGIKKVPVEHKADYSDLHPAAFWEKMNESNFVYPYDQYGGGPHKPELLPTDVRGLADDPYRSLAYKVRREGGYDKTDAMYAEFKWAEYFRKYMTLRAINDDFDGAVKEAMELAKRPEAARLPGYRPD